MTLYPVTYTKAQLVSVPEGERVMHFMLCGVANTVQMLQRTIILNLAPVKDEHRAVTAGRTAMGVMLMQVLAGRLYEAWVVLQAEEHSKLYREYKLEIPKESIDAFAEIKRYFNRADNLIKALRNQIAFHLDADTFKASYELIADETRFIDYMNRGRGNTFYESAAFLSMVAMARSSESVDLQGGLNRAVDEIIRMSGCTTSYIDGFSLAFIARHISPDSAEVLAGAIEIQAPRLAESRAAFFYEADESDIPGLYEEL